MPLETFLITLILPALIMAAGVAIFIVGRRGRRIDDHPLCRKCGFDLFGLPPDSSKCSECGAGIHRRRAVRIGNRQRRGRWAAMGLLIFTAGIAWSGLRGWRNGRQVEWIHQEPVFWLRHVAWSANAAHRDAAVDELRWRFGHGGLRASQIAAILDDLTTGAPDDTASFSPRWPFFMGRLHGAGRLSEDQWVAYAKACVKLSLQTREQAARGESLPLAVRQSRCLDSRFIVDAVPSGQIIISDAGGLTVPMNQLQRQIIPFPLSSHVTWNGIYRLSGRDAARLAAGPHDMKLTVNTCLWDYGGNPRQRPRVLANWTQELSARWNLLPASKSSVQLVTRASDAPAMAAAVTAAPGLPMQTDVGNFKPQERIALSFTAPPIAIAAQAILRVNQKEWPSREAIVVKAGEMTDATVLFAAEPGQRPMACEIILRPDPQLATESIDVDRIWGQDIVISNVKLNWPPSP
jgi:ribosomal protein L37E